MKFMQGHALLLDILAAVKMTYVWEILEIVTVTNSATTLVTVVLISVIFVS